MRRIQTVARQSLRYSARSAVLRLPASDALRRGVIALWSGGSHCEHTAARARPRLRQCLPHACPTACHHQTGDGHHGVGVNLFIRVVEDLRTLALRFELEACAAGSAHPERVPFDDALKRVIVLQEYAENLIGIRRIKCAPRS